MRLQISTLEKHEKKLFEKLQRLQNKLPDFVEAVMEYVSAWGRRKRWDFVMQNLRQLIVNLHQCAENMHTTLADLSASLKEDEATQGLKSVLEPHRRFQQEQMVAEVEQMRQTSLADFREATDLLRRLIDFTEPHEALNTTVGEQSTMSGMGAIAEDEHEQMVDMSPPKVVESRSAMKQVHSEMLAEIGEGGAFSRDVDGFTALADEGADQAAAAASTAALNAAKAQAQALQAQAQAPAQAQGTAGADAEHAVADALASAEIPKLIAIANFDPPTSHQAQMLRLVVGDVITVIGQDGKGWWYGQKQNGTEGWFPPSYVQTKGAHYSSAGARPVGGGCVQSA